MTLLAYETKLRDGETGRRLIRRSTACGVCTNRL